MNDTKTDRSERGRTSLMWRVIVLMCVAFVVVCIVAAVLPILSSRGSATDDQPTTRPAGTPALRSPR